MLTHISVCMRDQTSSSSTRLQYKISGANVHTHIIGTHNVDTYISISERERGERERRQGERERDYARYIKDLNNIWVYLNKSIKFHKPIHFYINDEVIKSYSKDNVELLIINIIESVRLYPREFLFINNKGDQYTEKGLQKMLYELVANKK
jgi:uncharacterized FlaG/YvyC family protein